MIAHKPARNAAFHLIALLLALPSASALAEGSPPMHAPCSMVAPDRIELLNNHLRDIKQELDLRPDQLPAWNTWSTAVLADAREQYTAESRDHQKWAERTHDDSLEVTDQIKQQESDLRDTIARLQKQLTRVESAEKNTATFYATLDRKQKTIFNLFWRLEHATQFHHGMMMRWHDHYASHQEQGSDQANVPTDKVKE